MKITKKKYLIALTVACSIVVIVGIAILWSIGIEMEKDRKILLGIESIEIKEREFAENPDIDLALTLLDRYRFVESIKDLDKAEFYGKKAIELGVNETGIAFMANIWLASVYHEKRNDIKACLHFLNAKEFQNIEGNNVINKKLIEDMGFNDEFIENCLELERQIKNSAPTS